jgi:hypothetical protein
MSDRDHDERRNAGAFLSPYGLIPAPMHTLSDEIPREPDDLEAERRGPEHGEAVPNRLRDRIRRLFGLTRR